MRINGKEITHNEYLLFSQIDYLRERYEALDRRLERMFDSMEGFDYSIDHSRQSESCYVSINDGDEWYEWSIRNHDNYANGQYDKDILLSHFDNWTQVKKNLLEEIENKLNEWRK